jgi:hypothetical protein
MQGNIFREKFSEKVFDVCIARGGANSGSGRAGSRTGPEGDRQRSTERAGYAELEFASCAEAPQAREDVASPRQQTPQFQKSQPAAVTPLRQRLHTPFRGGGR